MGPIFDTHAHYSAHAFDTDRYALLDRLPDQGVVGVCEQATHSGDAPKVLELAHRYPWVYAAIGIHPESLLAAEDCGEEGPAPTISVYGGDWAAEMKALAPYYDDSKVVAVGECGLDYHWPVPKDAQLALFEAELRLSLELGKPIIVHDRSAHADVYALLKKYQPRGIVHCYSGSADDAEWLAEQGLYFGFGGACPQVSQRQIFFNGHIGGRALERVLEQVADDLAALVLRRKRDVLPAQRNAAFIRNEAAGDGVEEGGFTGAVGAHDGGEIPRFHRKTDAVQSHFFIDGAGVERLVEVLQFQHFHLRPPPFSVPHVSAFQRRSVPGWRASRWPRPR